ncbi:MAG: TIGR04255 family protein [Thiobacillus sp.]
MNSRKLPRRLGREPLVDAVFEIRFATASPAANIIPGILFGRLGAGKTPLKIERLAAAQIPESIRKADPALRYSPLLSLDWGQFNILVGDENVALSCKLPYPRWVAFKEAIMQVVREIAESGVIQGIDRYSMKYVDMLPLAALGQQVSALNWNVSLGNHQLTQEIANLRIEIPREEFLHLVTIQTGAFVVLSDQKQEGVVVDVDTVCKVLAADVPGFVDELAGRLDRIHLANKTMFFECITPETEQLLEPEYE